MCSPIIRETLKMVLDTSLLNTQQYKVRIKSKVKPSRESPPLHFGVVAIEKDPYGCPRLRSTTLYIYIYIYIYIYVCVCVCVKLSNRSKSDNTEKNG